MRFVCEWRILEIICVTLYVRCYTHPPVWLPAVCAYYRFSWSVCWPSRWRFCMMPRRRTDCRLWSGGFHQGPTNTAQTGRTAMASQLTKTLTSRVSLCFIKLEMMGYLSHSGCFLSKVTCCPFIARTGLLELIWSYFPCQEIQGLLNWGRTRGFENVQIFLGLSKLICFTYSPNLIVLLLHSLF